MRSKAIYTQATAPSALTCVHFIPSSVFTCSFQTPRCRAARVSTLMRFLYNNRCPPLSSAGHSFRIYTCHFGSVVNIYELHYYIIECVAAVQLSLGGRGRGRGRGHRSTSLICWTAGFRGWERSFVPKHFVEYQSGLTPLWSASATCCQGAWCC